MAKYRKLYLNELNDLEKEFIEFLVINGITAEDWVEMKENNPEGTEKILVLFSDVVFESVLRKIRFLEQRGRDFVHVFHCLEKEIVLAGVRSDEETDFTNPDFISSYILTPPHGLNVYTSVKKYAKDRETELFEMLENGCVITDNRLFKAISMAVAAEKESDYNKN